MFPKLFLDIIDVCFGFHLLDSLILFMDPLPHFCLQVVELVLKDETVFG
jgi:hypothetical protein